MSREKATRWVSHTDAQAWHVAWDRRWPSDRVVNNSPIEEIKVLVREKRRSFATRTSSIIDGVQKIIPLPIEERFSARTWLWD